MKNHRFKSAKIKSVLLVFAATAIVLQVLSINNYFQADMNEKYKELWKQVEKHQSDGLPKSALEVVEQILTLAKAEKNTVQYYKAFVHKIKFETQTIDNGSKHALVALKTEADNADMPVRAFLQSLYAETLWSYYINNRWKILDRTHTEDFVPDDFETWDAKRLNDEIAAYYLKSLEKIEELKKIPASDLEEIIVSFKDCSGLRTTAFDLLAHRALIYFSSNDAYLTDLSNTFFIDNKEYFLPADQFVKLQIKSSDPEARRFRVIQIYQALTAVHLLDKSPEALVDVELMRLKYVRTNYTLEDGDQLYFSALQKLHDKYASHPVSTVIDYEIALYYKQKGEKYNHFTSPELQWEIKKAYEVCNASYSKFSNAPFAKNLSELMEEIKSKHFTLRTENNVSPDKPILMQIAYKNIDKLYFKIIDITDIDINAKTKNKSDTARLNYFNSLPPFKIFNQSFKDEGDYQQHTTEMVLEALPVGSYLIMSSPTPGFEIWNNKVDHLTLNVTNLSYIFQRNQDYSYQIHVMDREKGTPVSGVKADCWFEEYNYTNGRYETKRAGSWTTDAFGMFTIPSSKKYRNVFFDLSKGKEKLSSSQRFYQYEDYDTKKRMQRKTMFFTDRAIYRPGQTLYFKGILYDSDGETNKIVPNTKTRVILRDVNYQIVGELDMTSNEFGSFNGEFVLPEGGITGSMHISNVFGTHYFRMEEYKRPKFEVEIERPEQYFKLNEKIEMTGTAMAYAGYAIDGADVKYSITRSTYYPYRYFWWYYPAPPAATVMKQGDLKTDDNGQFSIDFIAEPEPTVQKKYHPAFIYTVQVDVTDINGETRSASTSIHVGYKSMLLSTNLSEFLNAAETDTVRINSNNLSGNELHAKGIMVITQVKPNPYQISRPWEKPDRPLMSQEEFKTTFPLLPWDDESQMGSWEKGKQVFNYTFDTEKNRKVGISNLHDWEAGWYHIKLTSVDPFGETIEYEHYFRIYNTKKNQINFEDPFWAIPEKTNCEPGETASIIVGSSAPDAKILVCVEHKGVIIDKKIYETGKAHINLKYPVEEKHRGNFTIHIVMTQHNRVFTKSHTIWVPHTDKQLSIKFETFRDKLLPGENEEWKLIIKDHKGDKALAEMAAVLYDASLDAFASHSWYMYLGYYDYATQYFSKDNNFGTGSSSSFSRNWLYYPYYLHPVYEQLNTYGVSSSSYFWGYGDDMMFAVSGSTADYDQYPIMIEESEGVSRTTTAGSKKNGDIRDETLAQDNERGDTPISGIEGQNMDQGGMDNIDIRTNFNETAFFYPELRTNEKGEIVIAFTVPESLTKWKMMGLAHTKDLKTGVVSNTLVTQKELMVMPNLPRFLREGDKLTLVTKISNLTEELQEGTAKLMLFDAMTMKPVDQFMGNNKAEVSFKAEANQSTNVSWTITIPSGISAVTLRIVASAGNHTDGEEHTLPVLVNKMLVTESMPLPIRSNQTKTFRHEKLIQSGNSPTMRHHNLTLEFTANPAWYAVQALPYMMEYPYECAEQVFSRYYSNVLATYVVNSKPEIKQVFDEWMKYPDSGALLSNLEKNQELKALVLEETPWVRDAKNESERKRRVALLFDLNKMSKETNRALKKLQKMQKADGGWVWFEGFPTDRYITQHIISGFGHLDHLNVMKVKDKSDVWKMVSSGISYIDREIADEYNYLKRHYKEEELKNDHLSYMATHYLYTRSFFLSYVPIPKASEEAWNYFMGQAKKYWLNKGLYSQGMIVLALHRTGDKETPAKILKSLDERSIKNEEMGMFWQQNVPGYFWWQAPIETQSILIEAFHEAGNDLQAVDDLKTWLLKQKQVQDWKTTKATTEAVYVLLLTGTDWLATEADIEITVGDQVFDLLKADNVEAGTGYFKTNWNSDQIQPSMGEVKVVKRDEGVSWGALYWQYFEDLDKITPHETPLKINKKLFIERMTPKGKVLEEVKDGANMKVGDKIIVRVELRVDRDMEYVHMKDMRAAGFEPINVLSQYKWQGGIGYYESTRDASTNFFFNRINKGTYVFEYPLRASVSGNFSNGITTIQCMYAPEFTSHSQGIRVNILP